MSYSAKWMVFAIAVVSAVASTGCSSTTNQSSQAAVASPATKAGAQAAVNQAGAGMYNSDAIRSTVQHNLNNPNLTPAERKIMQSEAPPGYN